jgi:hypothetical protein
VKKFKVLKSAQCSLLKAGGSSFSLDVLYGGLVIKSLDPDVDMDPDKNAGSVSAMRIHTTA